MKMKVKQITRKRAADARPTASPGLPLMDVKALERVVRVWELEALLWWWVALPW